MTTAITKELPVVFSCHDQALLGILHQPIDAKPLGVLLVVGGPQYRVGSHRQFVLLARMLADQGIPVLRFDYRGMGDAEGEPRTFIDVDHDIAAAIDAFFQQCPNLTGCVIWGLCDAASAALFYGYQDPRVQGLVLLNPWVYTEQGAATAFLKHYYLQRLLSPDFWRKVFSFKFNVFSSLTSLFGIVKKFLNRTPSVQNPSGETLTYSHQNRVSSELSLPERMKACLRRFQHPVLLILSGKDLTADEFRDVTAADDEWQSLLADERITRYELSASDHTFSTKAWRDQVAEWTWLWLSKFS